MAIPFVLATAEAPEPVASGPGLGIGVYALVIVLAGLLGWMAYLFVNSRRRAAGSDPAPPNLSPPASDDELENRKLTRVLRAALFGSALLAVALPWYAFNEPGRQEAFAETILEEDVEAGAHWYSLDGFQCQQCHGPDAGGGAAPFTEARSGVDVSWAVPSLNDVLYRYSEDEVRFWIVYGRAGTPMPSNGLEGGGAMTVQEVDQVIEYLKTIQIPQADAVAKVDGAVDRALAAIEGGETRTVSLINREKADIETVRQAKSKQAVAGSFPDDVKDSFQSPQTCTAASAALVGAPCEVEALDSDRDGLSDETEKLLTDIAATTRDTLTVTAKTTNPDTGVDEFSFEPNGKYDVRFDPFIAFTNMNPETLAPEPDLDAAERLMLELQSDLLLVGVTAEREQQFLAGLEASLEYLEQSLEDRLWEVDFAGAASDMGVSEDEAKRAVGLFNAYCARCHTGGYSAGPSFEQGAGSGAWGPSLREGRAELQFPNLDDQVAFVIGGSENGSKYGVNGLGSGRMPAFGKLLSQADIELIVKYERSL